MISYFTLSLKQLLFLSHGSSGSSSYSSFSEFILPLNILGSGTLSFSAFPFLWIILCFSKWSICLQFADSLCGEYNGLCNHNCFNTACEYLVMHAFAYPAHAQVCPIVLLSYHDMCTSMVQYGGSITIHTTLQLWLQDRVELWDSVQYRQTHSAV